MHVCINWKQVRKRYKFGNDKLHPTCKLSFRKYQFTLKSILTYYIYNYIRISTITYGTSFRLQHVDPGVFYCFQSNMFSCISWKYGYSLLLISFNTTESILNWNIGIRGRYLISTGWRLDNRKGNVLASHSAHALYSIDSYLTSFIRCDLRGK